MTFQQPWSKKHKAVTGGTPFSLSNSFVEPLSNAELIKLSLDRGDQEIVEAFHQHSLVYTDNGGSLDLRQAIAQLYGDSIAAENIVVFSGGQVALQTAAIALLDKDSHSIVFTPGYQSVLQAPLHAGSQVTEIPLYPKDHWQIDPKAVEAAIQANTKYMVINEPYNPAGTLMSRVLQQKLKDIAEKNDLYLLSDEVYRLLEHDRKDRLPTMADLYSKGLSAGTLSKPWGGCGITIGWLALQDLDLKQKLIDTQYFGTACPGRASEIQAIMTLRASDIIVEQKLKIIKHNLVLLDQFFENYSDLFEWVRPNAGAIGFVKFKGPLTAEELGEQLAQSGISIKPAYVFTGDNIHYVDYFRIGFGEIVMPKALEALIDFVEIHKQAWASSEIRDKR
jgi:aspartate/methionine/tyrosine aminotransferase